MYTVAVCMAYEDKGPCRHNSCTSFYVTLSHLKLHFTMHLRPSFCLYTDSNRKERDFNIQWALEEKIQEHSVRWQENIALKSNTCAIDTCLSKRRASSSESLTRKSVLSWEDHTALGVKSLLHLRRKQWFTDRKKKWKIDCISSWFVCLSVWVRLLERKTRDPLFAVLFPFWTNHSVIIIHWWSMFMREMPISSPSMHRGMLLHLFPCQKDLILEQSFELIESRSKKRTITSFLMISWLSCASVLSCILGSLVNFST